MVLFATGYHRSDVARLRPLVPLFLGVLYACAGDPAEFRPAKDAASYPSVKNAYRLRERPTECETLGVVVADGEETSIEDVAVTAARHGGTHYFVDSDQTQFTGYSGVVAGGMARLTADTNRSIRARVYRCAP